MAGGGTVSSGLLGSPNSGGAIACVRHGRPDFTDRRRDASIVLFLGVARSRAARGAHERGLRFRCKSMGMGVPNARVSRHISPAYAANEGGQCRRGVNIRARRNRN